MDSHFPQNLASFNHHNCGFSKTFNSATYSHCSVTLQLMRSAGFVYFTTVTGCWRLSLFTLCSSHLVQCGYTTVDRTAPHSCYRTDDDQRYVKYRGKRVRALLAPSWTLTARLRNLATVATLCKSLIDNRVEYWVDLTAIDYCFIPRMFRPSNSSLL